MMQSMKRRAIQSPSLRSKPVCFLLTLFLLIGLGPASAGLLCCCEAPAGNEDADHEAHGHENHDAQADHSGSHSHGPANTPDSHDDESSCVCASTETTPLTNEQKTATFLSNTRPSPKHPELASASWASIGPTLDEAASTHRLKRLSIPRGSFEPPRFLLFRSLLI